jgi:membrane protease YdiL (CAAX protease family)
MALAVAGLIVILFLGVSLGGVWGELAAGGVTVAPFTAMAYAGAERRAGRAMTVGLLLALAVGYALVGLALVVIAVVDFTALDPQGLPTSFIAGGGTALGLVGGAVCLALVGSMLGFVLAMRRAMARVLPFDPGSFVHTVALVAVLACTLVGFAPLLALGEALLLAAIRAAESAGTTLFDPAATETLLNADLLGLTWTVPCTFVAVGLGQHRSWREATARLGLARPRWGQVALGLLFAAGLVGGVQLLSQGIDAVWGIIGWPRTDGALVERMFGIQELTLGGALAFALAAGMGEELAVRGVLQPRLGLLLSNLFFTALHAFQYQWDSLLVVFLLGMVLGLIRRRWGTTLAIIVHVGYDLLFVLMLLAGW